MKRETLVAIVFGIVFGSCLAIFLLWQNRNSQFLKDKVIQPVSKTKSASLNDELNGKLLELSQPETGTIVNQKTVTIKGKAPVNALLVIQSPIKDMVLTNDKEDFSIDFPLAMGENAITVSAYTKGTQIKSQVKELKIYYLTQ